ncbi:MAG: MFS transporter [Lentisphaerae bacterium]|nr:MFS transporter [Lentisphaerota bacterium]
MCAASHDPYAALRHRHYLRYAVGGTLANIGGAMQSVAVGWDLYERTGSAMALGGVGLVQVLPIILLAVPAGHLADRLDRRRIMLTAQAVVATGSVGLALLSWAGGSVASVYTCLALAAIARAFGGPASSAFWPGLVPAEAYSNAVTWRSGGFQVASVLGPALAGLLIGWQHRAVPAYLMDAALTLIFWLNVYQIPPRPVVPHPEPASWRSLLAGFGFLWRTKVLLAAVSLDMFAVLLGGATALLPIYAKDILHVGPVGFGLLRAAPAAGAVIMTLMIAHHPPTSRAGPAMLWSVVGFGVATVVFGLSQSFWLSLVALALTGALDNISVVVRHSLLQLQTPDAMRGRVNAVNSVFISCSNELGAFESGTVAAMFGPVVSVVAGGLGTLAVVAAVALLCPPLRRLRHLRATPD